MVAQPWQGSTKRPKRLKQRRSVTQLKRAASTGFAEHGGEAVSGFECAHCTSDKKTNRSYGLIGPMKTHLSCQPHFLPALRTSEPETLKPQTRNLLPLPYDRSRIIQ